MACRCGDIRTLKAKKDKLEKIKERSSSFQENISCCETEQEYLEKDSLDAAKSEELKGDIEEELPGMEDKVEDTHEKVTDEINTALDKMDRDISTMKDEDTAHHFAEQMNRQNVG